MTHLRSIFAGALPIGLAVAFAGACAPPDDSARGIQAMRPASADHHVHIRSQAAAAHQDALMAALGERRPGDTMPSAAITSAEAIAALDSAGIEAALVLSNAYMYGMPDAPADDEADRVRAENEYVAEQAALFPRRLVGFCSVNPLRPYALDEVARCAADARIGGLKLHLANSDVDLRDDGQVETLGELFGRANTAGLPVLIHMRTRERTYGEVDARAFVERVLSRAPDIPVVVAHMAGWGGYDDATDAALGVFAAAREAGQLGPLVAFGLGAVVFDPRAAGTDTARAAQVRDANRRLAARVRQLGTDRILYATDWPAWPPVPEPVGRIEANIRLIRSALPLDPEELDRVFANVSPIFGWKRLAADSPMVGANAAIAAGMADLEDPRGR